MISWRSAFHCAVLLLNWLVAIGWTWRVLSARMNLPKVPDLLDPRFEASRPAKYAAVPEVCVIVPARNEADAIEDTLRSMLAIRDVNLEIIAVDDRSTDDTGAIMDAVAAERRASGQSLRVLHIHHLPDGWLGKPHAMAMAARETTAPWLLFTDADVVFREDSLGRALRLAEIEEADHLVLLPTVDVRSFGERMMIAFFNAALIWGFRAWRVPDPMAKRDFIGLGAFNLIRRKVYYAVGGYESLRMEVLDDVRLGFKVKSSSYRQCVAYGRDLIRIRWAAGALGVIHNLTKNVFAAFRFRPVLLLSAAFGVGILTLLPVLGLLGSAGNLLASLVTFAAILSLYQFNRRHTGISSAFAFTLPLAAAISLYAMVRSMAVTLIRGGVRWRGTLYPLRELRKHAGPLW